MTVNSQKSNDLLRIKPEKTLIKATVINIFCDAKVWQFIGLKTQ